MSQLERLTDYYQSQKIAINESTRLIDRSPEKYSKLVIGLWAMPLFIKGFGIVKDSYFVMRHIDDVIDGDLKIRGDTMDYVNGIRKTILNDSNGEKSPIEKLALNSLKSLSRRKKEGDNPKQDFLDGIDWMVFDYNRILNKEVFKYNDLKENHIKSFSPYANILLTAIKSNLRADDIKTFLYCQALAYSIQDLSTDFGRGLINIPEEILSQSNLGVDADVSDIISSPIIKEWIGEESFVSRKELNVFLEEINLKKNEKTANFLLNLLSKRLKRVFDSNIQNRRVIFVSGNS